MKVIIENVQSKLLIGGRDNLISDNLIGEFREYLRIKVPGAYFIQKKLKWHFDGYRYFLTPGGKMATGFLQNLLKLIEEDYPDLEVEIIDERENLPQFSPVFQTKVGPITINDGYVHQKELIECYNHYITFREQQIYFPRGVVDAATNSGKTVVITGIYLNFMGNQRMLVIIHRKTVYRELLEFFQEVFGEVGEINDQHYSIKKVTLAMIQTLSKRIEDPNVKKDLGQFTILAVDEAHRAGAAMYSKTLVHCNAGVRVFVSGSAFDSDDIISKMIIVGLSGPRLKIVTKREMMDKGISTEIKVKIHLCNTILRELLGDYDDHIKRLIHQSIERTVIVSKIIKERLGTGPIVIYVEETEHGKFILQQLQDQFIVELTHSKDPGILQKVEAFRSGELDVIIATGVLKEGLNMPLIATIIDCAGGKSRINIKQRMGRGERLSEGKTEVEYHDFYDVGHYVAKHSVARIKTYLNEQLDIEYDFDYANAKRLSSIVIK